MKKNSFFNFIQVIVLLLVFQSCYKDDSVGAIHSINYPSATGLNETYSVYSLKDSLNIHPDISGNDTDYSYQWLLYNEIFIPTVGGEVKKPDTLALTKNLDYFVTKPPGNYILTLNIIDNKTGITHITNTQLKISTLTMNGWYVLKDNGQETDFDFFYKDGKITDWISTFNNGKGLSGKALKAVFIPDLKTKINTTTDLFGALAVITENDVAMYKIENGELVYDFNNMFFTKPAIRKPQNILVPNSGNNITLINNNRSYTMIKGTLFADPAPNNFKISPIATTISLDLFFDENSKRIFLNDKNQYSDLKSNGDSLKNMKATPRWMGGYVGLRSSGAIIFKNTDNADGRLFKLNGGYFDFTNTNNTLIAMDKVIPAMHSLNSASQIAGNYDADILYYAKDNSLYMCDFSSLTESLITRFPEGSQVTSIQHIKYPLPSATVAPKINYIAVATELNGKYQVWLCSINSIGGLSVPQVPNFEGAGRVASINYLENGQGNRNY